MFSSGGALGIMPDIDPRCVIADQRSSTTKVHKAALNIRVNDKSKMRTVLTSSRAVYLATYGLPVESFWHMHVELGDISYSED